jgi:hypothetical protein
MSDICHADPVVTAPLFRPLYAELVELLRGLPESAWDAPTSAAAWRVRDVVAHLFDVDLRRISVDRDRHAPPAPSEPIESHANLVGYLDRLNAEWVLAARRVSPQLLTQLLEITGPELALLMERANPHADATYAVAWAGQARSPMWLDIAREYTERWHHQDQIREATGARPLDDAVWLRPALAVSMLAVPPSYAATPAPDGTTLVLRATGAAAAEWSLTRVGEAWRLAVGAPDSAAQAMADATTVVTAPALVLTRLLLHRLTEEEVSAQLRVEGDSQLAAPLLRARAVMV